MKRVAVVTTIYEYLSHAQHMADRLLVGYPHGGKWMRPDVKVVSLYVDQKPEGDLSRGPRARSSASRSIPPSPRRCAAAATSWPWTPS